MDEFQNFRELLEKTYTFPAVYPHKFIGRNSAEFSQAVAAFETAFPGLRRIAEHQSASGKHQALTYEFAAPEIESIVEMLRATYRLPDLLYIL